MAHSNAILQLRILICVAGSALPVLASASAAADPAPGNPATAQELPQVTVIGNTPLAGLGLPENQIPASVQTAGSEDLERQQALGIAEFLNNNFSGVSVNESANNPFQLDVNYHGFTASPLLGTPEGLSVYVDGVRVNESFGDTVNWDLIPQSAISTVTLISGSNPVFGLNTLGGALSVRTKSGHDNPGTEFEAYGGSFGRRSFEGESGGEFGDFDYFLTASYFEENGWRDFSASRAWQAFGKVGWQNDKSDLDLSYSFADTSLYGNGAVPQSMLDYRRETSYTPDFTENRLSFINLTGTHFLAQKLLLSGNLYYRHLATNAINGNVNDSYLDSDYSGPPFDCSGPAASRAELTWCAPGQNASGSVTQRTAGFGLQLTDSHDMFGWPNQAIVGGDYNDSKDTFTQSYQYGQLSADRMLIYEESPFNNQTVISLSGDNRIYGVYATDTLSPSPLLHLTLSIRYNRSTETLNGYSIDTDIGDFAAGFGEARPLAGDHTFSRVNPAFGFTLTPRDTLTFYADYNEASRAPTVIELGCADPSVPCGLPNDFASDPGLEQVVARTAELGVRGKLAGERLVWSAGAFRTINSNDIQFIATATNSGYFANVGNTRRQGFDLALGGRQGGWHWQLMYSLVDATFQSDFAVSANSNSTADANGDIQVRPGDRIPLIPRHTGRLILGYQAARWDLGANLMLASGSYLHGNENNANRAGGTNGLGEYVSGTGAIPGYAVVNLHGSCRLTKKLEVFARVVNLFDRQYSTAGFLTSNAFNPNGSFRPNPADWTNEDAVSPAQPRGMWAGLRMRLE
ncbi:MAG TPA: TonB-dependent receptor [Steroidobacteraceae bacterium]